MADELTNLAGLAAERTGKGLYRDERAEVLRGESATITDLPGSHPLSKFEHERYAHERSFGTAITIAAERAGLSRRSGAGSKLEQNKEVRERIAYLAAQEKAVHDEKRRRLEAWPWTVHDTDIRHYYEMVEEPWLDRDGEVIRDKDGNPLMRKRQRPKPLSKIPADLRQCIETITETESGRLNYKLYSKEVANRELRKINGIDKTPSFDDADPAMRLPDSEFFQMLTREAAELGVDVKLTFEVSPND